MTSRVREGIRRTANRGVFSLTTFFTRIKKVVGLRSRSPLFCQSAPPSTLRLVAIFVKVADTMRWLRFLPLIFFSFALLSAQQLGASHALNHALAEQAEKSKQAPHSPACERCEIYAQLGSALTAELFEFAPPIFSSAAIQHSAIDFQSIHTLVAVARGPPALLQNIA